MLTGIGNRTEQLQKRFSGEWGIDRTLVVTGQERACLRHVAGGSPAVLTAIVLICSILATPDLRDCDETNARAVMLVPEAFASPVSCAMHGQAYVAGTAIGRSLAESDRIKIVCRPRQPTQPPIAKRDRDGSEQARQYWSRHP